MSRLGHLFLLVAIQCIRNASGAWTMQQFRDAMKAWASSDSLDDPNDALRTWRDPQATQLCQFEGIDCYYYYDYYWITAVDMENLDLTGSIPPWMWATATESINLSNNQWYNTTVFYEDTFDGPAQDATLQLQILNCSNCGFYLKAEDGVNVLPEEWSRYQDLHTFDISHNPSLIGQLPMSWGSAWSSISNVHIEDTPVCEPFPFPKNGDVRVYGDYMTHDQCPELPPHAPWEPTPPDPPAYPPYYTSAPIPEPDDEWLQGLGPSPMEVQESVGVPISSGEEPLDLDSQSAPPFGESVGVPMSSGDEPLDVDSQSAPALGETEMMITESSLTSLEPSSAIALTDEDAGPDVELAPEVVEEGNGPFVPLLDVVIADEETDDDVPLEAPATYTAPCSFDCSEFPSPNPTAEDMDDIRPMTSPPLNELQTENIGEPSEEGAVDLQPNSERVIDVVSSALLPESPPGAGSSSVSQELVEILEDGSPSIEKADCQGVDMPGRLSAPQITSSSAVIVSLLTEDDEVDLCDQYECRIQVEPEADVHRRQNAATHHSIFWTVSVDREGVYAVTLTISDPHLNDCASPKTISFLVDTTRPTWGAVRIEQESDDLFSATLYCSEDILVTDPDAISVSDNGEIKRIAVDGRRVVIVVRRLSFRDHFIHISIPVASYTDRAGNRAADDILIDIPVEPTLGITAVVGGMNEAPVGGLVSGTIVVSGGLSTGAVMMGGTGSGGGFGLKSNIVRAGFHLQFLSLTANLAVPELSKSYRDAANKFSWTTLAFSGSDAMESLPTKTSNTTSVERRKLRTTEIVPSKADANRSSHQERDAFAEALLGYSAFLGICLCLRIVAEGLLRRWRAGKERPTILTFPRLDLQAFSITVPPLTFASTRLLLVGSASALQLSLFALIILVAPFTVWFVCCLTIRNLIVKPEIYIDGRALEESPAKPLRTSFKKKGEQNLFSTVSGDLIGVSVCQEQKCESTQILPLVPPHEEAIDDYVNEIERTLSTRVSSSPRTHVGIAEKATVDHGLVLRSGRIHPTTSADESRLLLPTHRQSTASATGIEIEPSDAPVAWESAIRAPIDSARDRSATPTDPLEVRELRLLERHPEKNFIKKFGFVFDDVTSLDPSVAQFRLRPRFLLTHAAFFLHKVLAAAIFGFAARSRRSTCQVVALLVLQTLVAFHLIFIRPYISRAVYVIETSTALLELSIMIGATLLLFHTAVDIVNSFMVICFYSAVFLLGLYELRHCFALCRMLKCRKP